MWFLLNFVSWYMYCARLVKRARLIPKVRECASEFIPAVEAIPTSPRRITGQHQLPMRAGTDSTSRRIDTRTLFLEETAALVDGPRRGLAHAILLNTLVKGNKGENKKIRKQL
jgi:hypothetical protein